MAGLGVLAVGALIAGCSADSPPVTPPTNGLDLTPVVSQGNRATLGSTVTYTATVRNTGNTFSDGPVTMTVVLPVGHTMISATGSGWDCAAGSGGATVECTTSQVVNPPDSMPVVTIEANVGGALGLDSLYAAISTPGDVNRANDTTRGRVTTSPSGAGDQLYVQMAGVLQLRSGGVVSSGDVTVTSDILGPSALSIDATVGTTAVEANLTRLGGTLFTGPVTITDPSIQGGDPLELNWRGELAGIGERPFNNLSGTQLNLRIPSLDLPGISAAALNGITFSLGITAVDGQRQGVVHTYADGGLNIRPSINVPDRVVTGAPFTLDADLVAESGASIGAVSADIDLPSDRHLRRCGKRHDLCGRPSGAGPIPLLAQRECQRSNLAEYRRTHPGFVPSHWCSHDLGASPARGRIHADEHLGSSGCRQLRGSPRVGTDRCSSTRARCRYHPCGS
ncbi:MAG: hypothetical protein V9F03_04125 [Microthrixaceae bacterium]